MEQAELLGAIARGWCHDKNANKVMDGDLAVAIAEEVMPLIEKGIQQGKREAWEEISKMVEENDNQIYQLHDVLAALRWNVKAKLSSLDNSSKE